MVKMYKILKIRNFYLLYYFQTYFCDFYQNQYFTFLISNIRLKNFIIFINIILLINFYHFFVCLCEIILYFCSVF